MRTMNSAAVLAVFLCALPVLASTPSLELPSPEPVPVPEAGLTIHAATSTTLSATYASPYATIDVDVDESGGLISSSVRSGGTVLTELAVDSATALDPAALSAAQQAEVDRMLGDPATVTQLSSLDINLLWTVVQMAEELSISLGGTVPVELINVTRSQPQILGLGYEKVMWTVNGPIEDNLEGVAIPTALDKADEKLLLGSVRIYPPGSNCNGACGPGCAWCIPINGWHVCYSNLFCVFHDAYCGAWWDFFDCDFFDCNFF